jgi:DAK2 domain fusion protein YloV
MTDGRTGKPGPGPGRLVLAWLAAAVTALERAVDEINSLNVFPVADADTGTNMLVTMRAAARAAAEAGRGPAGTDIARATVAGAVSGARGNSGVILSQILRAVAAQLGPTGDLTPGAFATALRNAVELVTAAVADPVEGTIVSVLRAGAEAADRAVQQDPTASDLAPVARATAAAAFDALLRTRDQLADNTAAGVVDAGGRGLLVLLDALVTVTVGAAPARPVFARPAPSHPGGEVGADGQSRGHRHDPPRGPHAEYEVMYLLPDVPQPTADRLRDELQSFGDSVVVVADADPAPTATWSVHTHTTEPGRAVQAGLGHGKLRSITVNVLHEVATEPLGLHALLSAPRAVVALVSGDGAAQLFEAEGAQVIRCDTGLTHGALRAALHRYTGREVLLMPNGALPTAELLAVAAQARESGVLVTLLPTSSMVQALAALAVHDPGGAVADDTYSMAEAAANARCGQVVAVQEDALTILGPCGPGDFLGMVGGEVVVLEQDQYSAAEALTELLLATGGELVTVLLGADSETDFPDRVLAALRSDRPEVEVVGYRGDQGGSVMEIAVE